MAFLPFVCVLAAGAVARADDLTSVDLREEVVSLRKQNAALTHRLAALEAARRDLRSDCADSTSWYYDYNPAKNCEAYVSKKSKNCKKKDEFKVRAARTPYDARSDAGPPQCPHPREPREIPP